MSQIMTFLDNLLGFILISGIPLLVVVVFLKNTRKKTKVIEEHSGMAKLIKKGDSRMTYHFGNVPINRDCFEVIFLVNDEQIIFEVSMFEYAVLEEGDEGLLVYSTNNIISFGDKLKRVIEDA